MTRRCSQRQFLLRPSALTNQIFAYCLALASLRTGVVIHAFCVLSDHWHGVVSDPDGRLPEFLEHVHKLVAKALNASFDRWENFWSSDPPSCVRLEDDYAVLREIVYTLANPVRAGLVSHGDDWPGLRTTTREVGRGASRTVRKPKVFFRKEKGQPESVTLRITPPVFSGLTPNEVAVRIDRSVEARETEIRVEFEATNRTFLGGVAVRRVSPFDVPKTRAPRRNPSPKVAAADVTVRAAAIARIKKFVDDYRSAFARWRQGIRDVLFPAGTYALRLLAAVPCTAPAG